MIDDRLREAARHLHDSPVDDPPSLGRHRRPIVPLVVCAVLVLGAVWVARVTLHRAGPAAPTKSTVVEIPATTAARAVITEAPTRAPRAVVPAVRCVEPTDATLPPRPDQSAVETTVPDGGYIRADAQLVCGDERTAIIENLLADVPVPEGFAVPDYGTSGPGWRSLVYEVSSAVVCAWLDAWFVAQAAADAPGMAAAAGAPDTAATWDMLDRDFISSHAEHVEMWVDAVNGRGGIGPSVEFEVAPTRELAESALVCTWRHR